MGNIFTKKERCYTCEYAAKQKRGGIAPIICKDHDKKLKNVDKNNKRKN